MENVYGCDGLVEKIEFWRERKDSRGIRNLHWTQMSSKFHYGTKLRYNRAITSVDLAKHLGFTLEETNFLVGQVVDLDTLKSGVHKYYENSRIDRECTKSSKWKSFDENSFIYETDPSKCKEENFYWVTEHVAIKLFAYLNKLK